MTRAVHWMRLVLALSESNGAVLMLFALLKEPEGWDCVLLIHAFCACLAGSPDHGSAAQCVG